MCRQFILIAIGAVIVLPLTSFARVKPVLTISPAHFHQTASDHLSGCLGMGIGVDINKKWGVTVAWELNQSVFLTMEPPMLDTNRSLQILLVEVVRTRRLPRPESILLRTGVNAGIGIERTRAYEYAESAVTYSEKAASQRSLGSDRKHHALAGLVVGLKTRTGGFWIGIDYRPKLYGIGNENAFVHSGWLSLRIPLGSL